jgi:hypothetical protein
MRLGIQFRRVVLMPVDNTDVANSLGVQQTALSDSGAFTFAAVPDGDYQVLVSDPSTGWAAADLHVAGRSPDALSMELRPPMNVRGRLEFRGSAPPPVLESMPMSAQYGLELRPARPVPGLGFSRLPLGRGNTFSARGNGPGPLQLRATVPAPWVQVAGIVHGVDTLDIPLPLGADTDDALIVFADHQTALLVKVTDDSDQPVANVGVLVFSDDSRYWPVRSRRVQSGQTMPGGACALSEFPPGKYFVVATREIGPGTPITPALIERLKSRALPFELAAGESRSVQVRVR